MVNYVSSIVTFLALATFLLVQTVFEKFMLQSPPFKDIAFKDRLNNGFTLKQEMRDFIIYEVVCQQ